MFELPEDHADVTMTALIFTRLNRFSVPWIAISLYGLFMCLGYMSLSSTANFIASPNNTLDPPSMFELPEDHADVTMTALIIDGTT
jgi:hypothetical protein